jgi:hypothetical protein
MVLNAFSRSLSILRSSDPFATPKRSFQGTGGKTKDMYVHIVTVLQFLSS